MCPAPHPSRFVQSDLSGVDRSKTPWVVVSFHRPMYGDSPVEDSGSGGDVSVGRDMQAHLEPLFAQHQVDMVREPWTGCHLMAHT